MEQQHDSSKDNAQAQAPGLDPAFSGTTAAQQSYGYGPSHAPQAYLDPYASQALYSHQQYMYLQPQGHATEEHYANSHPPLGEHQTGQQIGGQQQIRGQQQIYPFRKYQQEQHAEINNDPAAWPQTTNNPHYPQNTAAPFSQSYGNQGYTSTYPQYNPYMPTRGAAIYANSPVTAPRKALMGSKEYDVRPPQPNNRKKSGKFYSCVKDSARHTPFADLVPVFTVLLATFLHHHKHWSSDELVPYTRPKWVKYVFNMVYAFNTYEFLKENHLIGKKGHDEHKECATRALNADNANTTSPLPPNGAGGQAHEWNVSRALHVSKPESMPRAMDNILNSLFGSQGTGAARGVQGYELAAYGQPGVFDGFNDSYAVQKLVAEHYFRHIYYKNMDLCHVSAQAMGAAAAIKALQSENELGNMVIADPSAPADLQHDQMVMGMALSEVNNLLESKRQKYALGPDETVESVGKVALATIVKIKIDEETEQNTQNDHMQWGGNPENTHGDTYTKNYQQGSMRRARHDYTFDGAMY
ncbi:hypothetical protein GGI25_005472 [Coemansia spiralis]|uniref:Uncharacterized protein n=2 Tax=Coemansia TaxID=4863 RepID=A0A9W8FYK8_9FUNG|nr:hypothetical protein EDC05_005507 [Coemansia umbellata]KAJ2671508.1 hypothetical protein GGI25_005472 [Coemansia spiralis]